MKEIVVIIFLSMLCNIVKAQENLIINTAFWGPVSTQNQDGFFDQIMSVALGRLGMVVEIRRPPAERGLMNVNEGIDDGDGPRIASLKDNNSYKNLIVVPEKIVDVDFVAFSKSESISIKAWQDLSEYNVGIVTGWKILERNITKYKSLIRVKNPYLLFNLLKTNRIDVAVIDRWTGNEMTKDMNLRELTNNHSSVLASEEMYLFMHKKHDQLAQNIAIVLREMKKDGTYMIIYEDTLK